MSIESLMLSNHLSFYCPLLLPSLFPSIRVFSNESALCIRWPKYWSFSFSISPSNEYSWLISFRMDWLDCLAIQETLKSLLQHHSSKASVLRHSVFFTVQFSHLYMITGKTVSTEGKTKDLQVYLPPYRQACPHKVQGPGWEPWSRSCWAHGCRHPAPPEWDESSSRSESGNLGFVSALSPNSWETQRKPP